MFEHLPVITQGSLDVMVDKELPFFIELLKGCEKGADSPEEAIEHLAFLYKIKDSNPLLVKVVEGTAYGVAGELVGKVKPGLEWTGGMVAVAGVLTALRLIDRELEAIELEKLSSSM